MKKKILFLTIGSYVGGLEIVTLHLIRQLKAEGHELKCLVTGWNDGAFIRELEKIVRFDDAESDVLASRLAVAAEIDHAIKGAPVATR